MRGLLAIGIVTGLLIGCGGSAEEAPKPLSYHFDEIYLASVGADPQKASFDAQHDWTVSRAEDAKATSDLNEATMQIGIARNDLKAAHLAVENAVNAKKAAEKSADTNRVNQAAKDLHTAEDNEKASRARVEYLQAYINFMKRYQVYTASNMYWHEAKFEATKAQIAKQNNIAPKGVVYDNFPKQLEDRAKRVQREKDRAERNKQDAMAKREAWLKIQKQADVETGHPTTAWDPLMAKPAEAPAPTGTEVKAQPEPTSGEVAKPQ